MTGELTWMLLDVMSVAKARRFSLSYVEMPLDIHRKAKYAVK